MHRCVSSDCGSILESLGGGWWGPSVCSVLPHSLNVHPSPQEITLGIAAIRPLGEPLFWVIPDSDRQEGFIRFTPQRSLDSIFGLGNLIDAFRRYQHELISVI